MPLVICGPSGSGKSSIIERLLLRNPDKFQVCISRKLKKIFQNVLSVSNNIFPLLTYVSQNYNLLTMLKILSTYLMIILSFRILNMLLTSDTTRQRRPNEIDGKG